MSFSYQFGDNPTIDKPRFIVADTVELNHIFEDSEIMMAYQIVGGIFQSSMFFSPPAGRNLPSAPSNVYRVAAVLLNALASNKARMSSIQQLLDVKLNPSIAAKALRDQADKWLEMDDNSGAIFIWEQCPTSWAFVDRFWNQQQRQTGGGF